MNKTKLIIIIRNLLILFKNNSLTIEEYEKEIADEQIYNIENDYVSYKEIELICFLFENFPYYQILSVLNDLINHLKQINQSVKSKLITSLIEAYISSISDSINRRIDNEINAHLFELLHRYYQFGKIDYSTIKKTLTRNIIAPENNTGMDIAENYRYVQETIPGTTVKKEALSEQISKKNYSKNYSVESKIKKAIIKYLDKDSLTSFISAILELIEATREEDEITAIQLKELYVPKLDSFKASAHKQWDKRNSQSEDNLQLKLFA